MRNRVGAIGLGLALGLTLALGGCGGEEKQGTPTAGGTTAGGSAGATADPSTPRGAIEHQLVLLKAGDVEAFRACFTPRLRERITAEAMAEGVKEVGGMSLDDLVADVDEGEDRGTKTAKLTMKNGRTLTTLVLTDGAWLADTIWFR